jgi:hypothetical protein
MVLARVRIARTVPCETWAAAAISRWEQSEPAGAADGVLIFAVGFALALGRARHLSQHVAAELLSGALLAVPFGVGGLVARSSYGHELVEQRRQDGSSVALTSGPGASPG